MPLTLSNSGRREIDNNKLSTTDTSNTSDSSDREGESGTLFWNESANESDSDSEEEGNDVDEGDLEEEHSKTERAASPEVPKKELKWNKEGESVILVGDPEPTPQCQKFTFPMRQSSGAKKVGDSDRKGKTNK